MKKEFMYHLKKITALLLTVAMVLPMNTTLYAASAGYTDLSSEKFWMILRYNSILAVDGVNAEDGRMVFHAELDAGGNDKKQTIKTSDIESVTSFTIDSSLYFDLLVSTDFYHGVGDWSDLSRFTNLKELTIKGVQNITNLQLPAGIEKLTIDNCGFKCDFDIKNGDETVKYPNLTQFVFTNNTFDTGHGINDLNSLTKLTKVTLDRSNITSVNLCNVEGAVTSAGLEFSAQYCTSLKSIDFGKYTLIKDVRLRGCENLEGKVLGENDYRLIINGSIDDNQTLDIRECYKLKNMSLSYSIADSKLLTIDSTGITSGTGSLEVARSSGTGKYKLVGFSGTYLRTAEESDTYSALFDTTSEGGEATSSDVAFIIFEQDHEKFLKEELWKTGNASKLRDYSANPIVLRVGESVTNNNQYLYTAGGVKLNKTVTSITTQNADVPSGSAVTYKVVEVSTDGKTITAIAPGKVEVTFTASNGEGSKSATQVIYVYSPVASISMTSFDGTETSNAETSESNAKLIDEPGKYYFRSQMTVNASNVYSTPPMGVVTWNLYKKDTNGTWELISPSAPTYKNVSTTGSGLEVHFDGSYGSTAGDPIIHNTYSGGVVSNLSDLNVKDTSSGGQFMLKGTVVDNYSNGTCSPASAENPGYITSTNELYFTVINVNQSHTRLGYGFADETDNSTKNSFVDEITFETIELGSTYEFSADFFTTLGDADWINEVKSYLTLEKPTGIDNKYSLKFNSGKTSKEIAEFLKKYVDKNEKIKIRFTIKNGANTYTKTYDKEVELYGRFKVQYDNNGGTLSSDNSSRYYIPAYLSQVYYYDNVLYRPTMDEYECIGWHSEALNKTITELGEPLGDLSLKAVWSPKYNITYNLGGGTNNPSNPPTYCEASENITLRAPSKSGYEFIGWTGSNGTTPQKTVVIVKGSSGHMTFTAHWKEAESDTSDSSDSGNESNTSSDSGSTGQSSGTLNNSTSKPTLATYTEPGKTKVFEVTRIGTNGVPTTVALHADGTIEETTPVAAAFIAGMNTSINMEAPTAVSGVDIIVEKTDASANAKVEKVTAVVDAKTINGNINITPQMLSNLKAAVNSQLGTTSFKTFDIRVNTIAADGKPLAIVVSTKNLKNNTSLKVYARDPIYGGYIMLNVPDAKYTRKIGLVTQALVSGLEYHYVSVEEGRIIENNILKSISLTDAYANAINASPGSIIDMNQAITPVFHYANVAKIEYSVSGKDATINPNTGLLVVNSNAKKGTFTVTMKFLLTNGMKKTVKAKVKIQ